MSKYFHNMLMIFLLHALFNPSNSLAAISYSIKNPEPAIGFDPNNLPNEADRENSLEAKKLIDFFRKNKKMPKAAKIWIHSSSLENLILIDELSTAFYRGSDYVEKAEPYAFFAQHELKNRGWCRGYPKTTPIEDQVYAGIIYLPCKSAA